MFPSTQPTEHVSLMHLSEFGRRQGAGGRSADTVAGGTQLSALNPTLVQDLQRFDRGPAAGASPGAMLDMLEVLAAALRHGRALLLHLQLDQRVLPLTVRPAERALQSPLALNQLLALRLPDLRVLRVEPARDAGEPALADTGAPLFTEPLGPLLWELALRGARDALLPEIGGVAAYRVAPGAELQGLELTGTLAAAVARLHRQTTPLREIAAWPGFDRDRAVRLLNALYLQAALMVSRTHPAAISPG
jgi:hypothetical protein